MNTCFVFYVDVDVVVSLSYFTTLFFRILDYYQQYFENNPVLSFNSNRRRYLKEMKKTVKGKIYW